MTAGELAVRRKLFAAGLTQANAAVVVALEELGLTDLSALEQALPTLPRYVAPLRQVHEPRLLTKRVPLLAPPEEM